MADTSEPTDARDAADPTELREEVEQELDELVDDAAQQERERMAEREQQGVDNPSEPPA